MIKICFVLQEGLLYIAVLLITNILRAFYRHTDGQIRQLCCFHNPGLKYTEKKMLQKSRIKIRSEGATTRDEDPTFFSTDPDPAQLKKIPDPDPDPT